MEGNRISKPNRYPCPAQTNIAKCLPLNIAILKYSNKQAIKQIESYCKNPKRTNYSN